MTVSIRTLSLEDYSAAIELWKKTEGIGLNDADTKEGVRSFLERNPEMSAVAVAESGALVGAVLCGHDGRRGYLHHLAVDRAHRNQGIAARLVARCLERLAAERILKCNVFLYRDNTEGAAFWQHLGFLPRGDLLVLQKVIGG